MHRKRTKGKITNLSSVESGWDREMDNTYPDEQRDVSFHNTGF